MKVAVVILNYNGADHLKTFLPSVIQYSKEAEIWVADNASTDDSIEILTSQFNAVKVLEMTENTGYAGGYNRALSGIQADLLVLLNSDVEVTPNWLLPFIGAFEDKKLAAAQPKILSYNQKDYFEYAGAAGGFLDKWGYPFCRGRVFDTSEKDLGQYDDELEIAWATGACLVIRSDVFQKLGGFDELFFAHMEEIDLCWRIRNEGYSIKYFPESTVLHLGGGTLNKSNPRKTFLNYRNGLAILFKNLPLAALPYRVFVRLILDGVSGIKLLLDGKPSDFWAVLRAHFAFYRMIPYLRKKSKGYPKSSLVLKKYSVVWQYFVKGNKKFSQMPNHD
ncbi:glycosyltransferase family 2 protein [Jiulongibacter sediminis]|uniref:glycosyltransferase family 2 protein n=1 Tax=Jiulongibacter sediminis TaxID=1605367 RepID=UPI0026EC9427|nr:glycosyltransferase family 2 protein [Jiulongibacter sediminis]